MQTKIVNGHKAEIMSEFVALMARDSDGVPMSTVRPEIIDGRVTQTAVRAFAARVGAAQVEAVRQFTFMYDTPGVMSYTRGTIVKTRRYNASGKLLQTRQETIGY